MDVRLIVDCKTSLGEGPVWDVQDQKIYWIDSLGNKVFCANQDGSGVQVWDVPSKIGSLAIRNDGGASLSLQNGFYAFNFETGKCTLLLDPEPALDGNTGSIQIYRFTSWRTKSSSPMGRAGVRTIRLSSFRIPGRWRFPPAIGTRCPGPLQISGPSCAMIRRGARTAFQMERLLTLKDICGAQPFFRANCAVSRRTEH